MHKNSTEDCLRLVLGTPFNDYTSNNQLKKCNSVPFYWATMVSNENKVKRVMSRFNDE